MKRLITSSCVISMCNADINVVSVESKLMPTSYSCFEVTGSVLRHLHYVTKCSIGRMLIMLTIVHQMQLFSFV